MPTRLAMLLGSLLGAALLTGCYGQTDLASRVGNTAATLNAHGTTDHGPATTWFEYWPTAHPESVLRTPDRAIPGGVSGPVSARVFGLTTGVFYSYRLCGRDQSSSTAVCAQTRRLRPGAANVQVIGSAHAPDNNERYLHSLDVDAFSPTLGHAFGHYVFNALGTVDIQFGSHEDGNVTCVAVTGTTAVIALAAFGPEAPSYLRTWYIRLFDRGPAGSGEDRIAVIPGSSQRTDPTDCSSFSSYEEAVPVTGDLSVSAPESQPTAAARR
jgi:hypothetical protein